MRQTVNMEVRDREQQIVEGFAAVVRLLVDRPDDVHVVSTGTVLRLSVHETDLGKVIGKQGRIAKSLRILLLAMSVGADQREPSAPLRCRKDDDEACKTGATTVRRCLMVPSNRYTMEAKDLPRSLDLQL